MCSSGRSSRCGSTAPHSPPCLPVCKPMRNAARPSAEPAPARCGRCAAPECIRRDLLLFASPAELGDFLPGLFALAREEAQRDRDLLGAIHGVVTAWNDDSFLTALPSLRLAFMYFTAREKVHLARSEERRGGKGCRCR